MNKRKLTLLIPILLVYILGMYLIGDFIVGIGVYLLLTANNLEKLVHRKLAKKIDESNK